MTSVDKSYDLGSVRQDALGSVDQRWVMASRLIRVLFCMKVLDIDEYIIKELIRKNYLPPSPPLLNLGGPRCSRPH